MRVQARSFVEESRDLPKIAPAAVKHAFVDVADCAGHHLLGGRLPDRIFRVDAFRNHNGGDILDTGPAVTPVGPDVIERM
ncbi:hypothetical protein LB542_05005 [Mesorhizobium sp. BR1-1-9]|uniref:hypothetical protein n=1 Tax=Mesorhizobium sp. BR1-1-9 TaxID=2876646 RepID=UPI001CD17EBB|nr:hypothetical protein [Mesorhizobium sp. BR1-1-9]MBZ9870223.1 hypothetical protein [Mesorhizobium sp. BR1-1-9]